MKKPRSKKFTKQYAMEKNVHDKYSKYIKLNDLLRKSIYIPVEPYQYGWNVEMCLSDEYRSKDYKFYDELIKLSYKTETFTKRVDVIKALRQKDYFWWYNAILL